LYQHYYLLLEIEKTPNFSSNHSTKLEPFSLTLLVRARTRAVSLSAAGARQNSRSRPRLDREEAEMKRRFFEALKQLEPVQTQIPLLRCSLPESSSFGSVSTLQCFWMLQQRGRGRQRGCRGQRGYLFLKTRRSFDIAVAHLRTLSWCLLIWENANENSSRRFGQWGVGHAAFDFPTGS